ncbi:MAG: glycoside hydrolase family 3 C-terminal domain-containing protein [Candidatus Marinimicrobia bacterium]|nr:glycoside hydrolase family 3 C-terminal domain-containing protein [Candidatus Neomarinimicrobiota bacterium]
MKLFNKHIIHFISIVLIIVSVFSSCSKEQHEILIYKDPNASIENRIIDLIDRMTLEEKIAQLSEAGCDDMKEDNNVESAHFIDKNYKNGIGTIHGFQLNVNEFARAVNKIQKYLVEETRLGIPAIFISESLHGLVQDGATIFPQAIGMASSWNPELINEVGIAIHKEVKAVGASQVLSPVLDVVRDLRWGRVEETYGEDPFLVSSMGIAMIKGLQEGNDPGNQSLCATAKHFLAYSAPHGGLNLASSVGGVYDLYNIHLPSFKAAVQKANILSVMSVYNAYNGEALTGSKAIYTDLLRNQLGFKGYVYSDWGSVAMLHYFHKVVEDYPKAGKLALEAGVDLEAPGPHCYQHLDSLVKIGEVDVKIIDQAVSRILYTKFKTGLFENPYANEDNIYSKIHTQKHIDLAKKMADESIVLLKNENNLLPLDVNKLNSIAVVGPNADQVQFGDYTWTRDNKDGYTLLDGLKQVLPETVKINYAKGCDIATLREDGIQEAVKAAQKSDAAIVAIGTASASLARDYSNCTSGEGFDLSDLDPTGKQQELVEAVAATGKPTIVVLIQGKPFSMPWIKENISAIVETWYPGEQGGLSIAELLVGKVNPSGRLPVSFPKSVGHLPCYYNHLPTDKGYYRNRGSYDVPGRDYVFSSPDALWPFGFGLSYTDFEYSNMAISGTKLSYDDELVVTVDVSNTGKMDGKETVQLYIRQEFCSITRPVKELKAFKKIEIKKGEKKQVTLKIKLKDCGYYNKQGEYLLEPGKFKIMVGSSSEDIKINQTFEII